MAPHLVVQWGKEVLHPVVQGGMLPRPQGVQVEEGIPQMFLQFKRKVRFQGPQLFEVLVYHLQHREVQYMLFFKDSLKLLNVHLDIKSIHCTY